MWITQPFVDLMRFLGDELYGLQFHTCMFGAPRKKQTALWTNIIELKSLSRECNGEHSHAPWGLTPDGRFATADECAYNSELCAHWAQAIHAYAVRCGISPVPGTLDEVQAEHLHVAGPANKAILGNLPRGNKLPPLLTDFLEIKTVICQEYPFLAHAKPGSRLPDNAVFPKGARLMQLKNDYGGDDLLCGSGEPGVARAEIGIPVQPLEYLSKAAKLVHPDLMRVKLSPQMEEALSKQTAASGLELRRERIAWTKQVVEIAKGCADKELELMAARPDHLRERC